MTSASNSTTNATSILHLSTDEIQKAISASKQVTAQFNEPPKTKFSLKREILLKIMLLANSLTKKKIDKISSGHIEIGEQNSGKTIKIKSTLLSLPGFAVVEKSRRTIIGVSPLLDKGLTTNITITLSEVVDGQDLTIRLYKDNGDGVFNSKRDKWLRDKKGMPIFRGIYVNSIRNLKYVYYSNYLSEGLPALLLKEQLSGKKITFESVSFPSTKKENFIIIRKTKNNLPDKIVSTSNVLIYGGSSLEILLEESVSNETLFAMVYNDNGDNVFNEEEDFPTRGADNLPIIVKFKVINSK